MRYIIILNRQSFVYIRVIDENAEDKIQYKII